MANKKIEILCSFDDGDQLDMRLADMLLEHKIPSVFYIPANCDLTEGQIEILSGQGDCPSCKKMKTLFDLGAHTMTHPKDLKRLSYPELIKEIGDSKKWLEKIIKRPVTKFCYPSGRYNSQVKLAVREAGFLEARTVNDLSIEFPEDKFAIRPTVHVYPSHERYGDKSWKELAEDKFDEVLKNGGRFELWGHSWEIEKFNMWEFLEDTLGYMDGKMEEINYKREV